MRLPLEGIRVLAVEQFGAGPYGSMYLADLGAEVIKIENRRFGGDAARQTGAATHRYGDDDSAYYQAFNLNKKSVTLDLKNPESQPLLHALVASADVVWNNLRGNQPARLGLDYASLKAVNPQIICSHISAYGRDNDRTDWPGYDYLMQAECGYLHLTGEPESPPARFGLSIVDFMTGIVAGLATVAALLGRERDGGCDVDTSLFDVALHQLTYPGTWYMNHGTRTGRAPRSAHPSNTPVQLYQTADGWIFIMAMTQKFWELLLETAGREDLGEDPRFANMADRTAHRDELTDVLDEVFQQDTTDNWIGRLQRRVPVAPVYDLPQALDNPFVEQIDMIQHMPHPHVGKLKVLRSPVKLAGRRLDGTPGHGLGADNEAIFGAELGFSAQLDELRDKGVI
ncbi:MAG: CoA transferase [Gammaproteobacteria bacterium]|nr:CoA transferase [Gammaproteobacteria bacterium]